MDKQHLKEKELRVQHQQALAEQSLTKYQVNATQTVSKSPTTRGLIGLCMVNRTDWL